MKGRHLSTNLLPEVAGRFKVLGEAARLSVLNALCDGPMNVSALIEATGLNQANLSKHLQLLHAHSFVSRRRQGAFVYYAIADKSVFALCDLMCGQLQRRAAQRLAAHRR